MSVQAMCQRVHGAAEHQQVYVRPSASSMSDHHSDLSSQVGRCLGFSAAQHCICMPAIPSQFAKQRSARGCPLRHLPFCYLAQCIAASNSNDLQYGAIQDGQADSCRGVSEATAQSPSAYDRLATLEAMVADNSPDSSPSSPDSHLRRCQQEY